ncbi:MAG: hypothetical protein KA118_14320 [Verrucomicrobia bacterium]|nr:hypothetical protein [Verrucomicrobiota bacterium]
MLRIDKGIEQGTTMNLSPYLLSSGKIRGKADRDPESAASRGLKKSMDRRVPAGKIGVWKGLEWGGFRDPGKGWILANRGWRAWAAGSGPAIPGRTSSSAMMA